MRDCRADHSFFPFARGGLWEKLLDRTELLVRSSSHGTEDAHFLVCAEIAAFSFYLLTAMSRSRPPVFGSQLFRVVLFVVYTKLWTLSYSALLTQQRLALLDGISNFFREGGLWEISFPQWVASSSSLWSTWPLSIKTVSHSWTIASCGQTWTFVSRHPCDAPCSAAPPGSWYEGYGLQPTDGLVFLEDGRRSRRTESRCCNWTSRDTEESVG